MNLETALYLFLEELHRVRGSYGVQDLESLRTPAEQAALDALQARISESLSADGWLPPAGRVQPTAQVHQLQDAAPAQAVQITAIDHPPQETEPLRPVLIDIVQRHARVKPGGPAELNAAAQPAHLPAGQSS